MKEFLEVSYLYISETCIFCCKYVIYKKKIVHLIFILFLYRTTCENELLKQFISFKFIVLNIREIVY